MPRDRTPPPLNRSELPAEFTPESIRALDLRTARQLTRPGNGVLTPDEQAQFDRALREALQDSTNRLGQSLRRTRRPEVPPSDPDLRRSYQRTRRRLDEQAARARQAFPELTRHWDDDTSPPTSPGRDDEAAPDTGTAPVEIAPAEAGEDDGDDVSVGRFESEIEQTSDTLEILEQIAGIQRQQLDHQRSQLLSETRGVFFALAVSVAVIVAGIAPLVEASPADRRLILLWTAVVCAIGGLGYALVRAVQSRSR